MQQNKPLVTVYCLTYNHEKYIRQCLDGILMQKTQFSYDIIVHDDASSDHTQDIIRDYESKYPNIIHAIYQEKNQYSQKIPIIRTFIAPLVKGEFVAICEGDDYWTDENKLQEQVSLLIQNPDSHFCVCGVQEVSESGNPLHVYHPNFEIAEKVITSQEFIRFAGTYSFQTSSYIMRSSCWKDYINNPPDFLKVSDIGDLPYLLYFGSLGNVVYVNKIMSCYRRGAPTSYSSKKNNWSVDKRIDHFERAMKSWNYFDSFSEKRYHDVCIDKISQNMFGYSLLKLDARMFFKAENREYFARLPLHKKIYVLAACVMKKTLKDHYLRTEINSEKRELDIWANAQ